MPVPGRIGRIDDALDVAIDITDPEIDLGGDQLDWTTHAQAFPAPFCGASDEQTAARACARTAVRYHFTVDAVTVEFNDKRTQAPISSLIAEPRSAGERTVFTPAASSALNFSSAVPLPPEMIAPA